MEGPSRTAILVAAARGMHAEMAEQPLVEDALSAELCSEEELTRMTELASDVAISDGEGHGLDGPDSLQEVWKTYFRDAAFAASSVVRNRYAEDCLDASITERGIDQYVIVGAGLDTFAWRRPELTESLTIFELDLPVSQRYKRERLDAAGLAVPDSVRFVPVDLAAEPVSAALADTTFDETSPAFYSWLGVTPYLSSGAIFDTLRSIADASAAGSEVVFDFVDERGCNPETTTPRIRRMLRMVDELGEPFSDGLALAGLEDELEGMGFELLERLDPAEQRRRYFDGQPDYFRPTEHYHFVHLRVA